MVDDLVKEILQSSQVIDLASVDNWCSSALHYVVDWDNEGIAGDICGSLAQQGSTYELGAQSANLYSAGAGSPVSKD